MQASKAYICATQFLGLSSKRVSYQVKNEYAPNLFKKKKISKKVLSGFLEVGMGQSSKAMASHPPAPPPPPTHTFSVKRRGRGGGGRGGRQAVQDS